MHPNSLLPCDANTITQCPQFAQRYKSPQNIGKGGFSTVFKAWLNQPSGLLRAIKCISINTDENESVEDALEEYRKTQKCKHENIITVHGVLPLKQSNSITIVCIEMDYMEHGSLLDLLHKSQPFYEDVSKKILRDMVCALTHMWDNFHMLHRDVKPGNILIRRRSENDIDVCLSDFGNAKEMLSSLHATTELIGTPNFEAPELLRWQQLPQYQKRSKKAPYSVKSDIFALGVTMAQLVTGDILTNYASLSEVQAVRTSLVKKQKITYSEEFMSLIEIMLNYNPNERPSYSEILRILSPKTTGIPNYLGMLSTNKLAILMNCPDLTQRYHFHEIIYGTNRSMVFKVNVKHHISSSQMCYYSTIYRALKCVIIYEDEFMEEQIKQDALMTMKFAHENVVPVHQVLHLKQSNSTSIVCIEMEYLCHGSLEIILDTVKPFEEVILRKILKQTSSALKYIYDTFQVLHMDVTPGNILIRRLSLETNDICVCLYHFALAKQMIDLPSPPLSPTAALPGTMNFFPPELFQVQKLPIKLQKSCPFSVKSDIFALGVTMAQLITRDTSVRYAEIEPGLVSKHLVLKQQMQYSHSLIALVERMLNHDPNERPYYDEILKELAL